MQNDDRTAGDLYRTRITQGSMFSGLLRFNTKKPPKNGPSVRIVNAAGEEVWVRRVATESEARRLADLIHQQVLTAGLADFEHWLLTEGRSG
ncbi:MAG: hypothetical protein ABR548_13445 [Actinomycetota bacterium]|nr:hypothetical protein [Actinomycetota bacterium]